MGSNYQKMYEKDYSKLVKKVDGLDTVIKNLNATITNLNNTITNLNTTINSKDELIAKLVFEIQRSKNNGSKDSSNSSKPSSTDGFKNKKKIPSPTFGKKHRF